jgi:hypothetical protein
MIVKVKFLRNGVPSGRTYSYTAPDDGETYKAGDYVYLSGDSVGLIVETDVPEDKAGYPVDKLRTFIGRAENPDTGSMMNEKET